MGQELREAVPVAGGRLAAIDPVALARDELLDPRLQAAVWTTALPRGGEQPRHRGVGVLVRCTEQDAFRARRDGSRERGAGKEAVLDEAPEADRRGAAAEERRIV